MIGEEVEILGADGAVLGVHDTDGLMLDGLDTDVLFGPDSWLDSLRPVMSVSVTDGRVRWTALDETPAPTAASDRGNQGRVRSRARSRRGDRPCIVGSRATRPGVHERGLRSGGGAARRARGVRRGGDPTAPDLYVAAGLEFRHHSLARAGFDWDANEVWRQTNQIVATYGMEHGDASAFLSMSDAVRAVFEGEPDALGASDDDRLVAAAAYVALLERPEMAEALWDRHAARDDPTELGRFAEVLREQVGPIDSDGLDWIVARASTARRATSTRRWRCSTPPSSAVDERVDPDRRGRHTSDRGDAIGRCAGCRSPA